MNPWLWGFLLVAATLLAYWPATRAGFIWDDDAYVTNNPLLTEPDGWKRIWFSQDSPSQYFPMVFSILRVEYALWGLHPAGYHWVNILLHAANALLVWRLLKRLKVPGAWLAAAIFALHPVHVESVAWVTELKNVSSLLFSLLAVACWLEFVEQSENRPWRHYLLALLFQALALFSKTTACTLPVALLLVLWLKKIPITPRRLVQVLPFVGMGLAMGFVTMWWERHYMQALEKVQPLGLIERFLVAGRAVWFYVGKLLWPANLTFSYPRWTINPADALAYGWLVALAGLAAIIWWGRRRTGRGPETAALFYVATLSPLLGFVMLVTFRWSFVADHYQYVASIGPIALVAAAMTLGFAARAKPWPWLKPVACATLLAVLGGLTWRQCGMYANLETLWRTTLARNPDSWMAHVNLGNLLFERGDVGEGAEHFQRALALHPNDASVYFNIGNAYGIARRESEAIPYFQKAVQIEPNVAIVHNRLGSAYYKLGRMDDALAEFELAAKIQPNFAEAANNAGILLLQKGRIDDAIQYFRTALGFRPGYAEIHNSLGNALLRKGETAQAIAEYETALSLQPRNADTQYNLGHVLLATGRLPEAVAHFQSALEVQPDLAEAWRGLLQAAWIWSTSPDASARNGARALEIARQIDQLAGGRDAMAARTLAAALAETGRFPDAAAAARRALQAANSQGNASLAAEIPAQIQCYESSRPFRDLAPAPLPH